MKNVFIEATNGPQNWGKFMVGRFNEEWTRKSEVGMRMLLSSIGWNSNAIIVFDLQTCEGAAFTPGGLASSDLNQRKISVSPLFEPFLEWLYQQDLSDLNKLPKLVDLPHAEFQHRSYRRSGRTTQQRHYYSE
jgi:hypothetical protein